MTKPFLPNLVIFSFAGIIFLINPQTIFGQQEQIQLAPEEKLEARIENITEEKGVEVPAPDGDETSKQLYQKLELLVMTGSLTGKKITIENGAVPMANVPKFKVGDEVVVSKMQGLDGQDTFFIADYIRRGSLLWLFIIFAVLTVIIGRLRGLTSLVGMGISFAVIFLVILPQILAGNDPIFISIIGSLLIIPVTFYLSHGVNKKTTIAIVGTLAALVVTGILANIFVEVSKLTGFVSEEAGFLQVAKHGVINIKGLFLAGIIIGVLGVLDDVTVSQAAVVQQLKEAGSNIKPGELYKRAMDVGQDHIASMVNTLVLVYAGAALPLLLLFVNNPRPFSEVINYEIIAGEVVRTLVGSIGLILAVPITTFIAVVMSTDSSKV